jgi:hypothetical protein
MGSLCDKRPAKNPEEMADSLAIKGMKKSNNCPALWQ